MEFGYMKFRKRQGDRDKKGRGREWRVGWGGHPGEVGRFEKDRSRAWGEARLNTRRARRRNQDQPLILAGG